MTRYVGIGVIGVCLFVVVLAFAGGGDEAATQPVATQPAATQPAGGKELFEYAGHVLGPDGKPVEGAAVEVYEQCWFRYDKIWKTGRTLTDSDGKFSMKGRPSLPYNDILLLAHKAGMAVAVQEVSPIQSAYCVMKLGTPAVLTGTVVDDDGKPVAGAKVCPDIQSDENSGLGCLCGYEHIASLVAVTDENGRFRMDILPADAEVFIIQLCANGMATVDVIMPGEYPDIPEKIFPLGDDSLQLHMHKEAVISGKLVEKGTDNPVSGVAVEVFSYGHVVSGIPPALTGEDGSFKIDGLDEGDYVLQVAEPPNWSRKWAIEPCKVSVLQGQAVNDIKLDAVKCSVLRIELKDRDNKPVSGYPFEVRPVEDVETIEEVEAIGRLLGHNKRLWGESGTDGVLEVPLLPGKYTLDLLHSNIDTTTSGDVELKYDEYDTFPPKFELTAGECRLIPFIYKKYKNNLFHVKGAVVDSTGAAVPGAFMTLAQESFLYPILTDRKGAFCVPCFMGCVNEGDGKPVRGTFIAQCFYNNLAGAAVIELPPKGPPKIVLTKAAVVTGKIAAADGKPLSESTVEIALVLDGEADDFLENRKIWLEEKDEYRIECLPAGAVYELRIKSPDYGYAYTRVDVPKDADKPIVAETVALPPQDKSISGVIIDENNSAVPWVIWIWQKGQDRRLDRADKNGKFNISKLVAGEVRLEIYFEKYESKEVTVQAGDNDVKIIMKEKKKMNLDENPKMISMKTRC